MNLKHDRGPIRDHIRATFRELCRQPRIDGLLESSDKAIATLLGETQLFACSLPQPVGLLPARTAVRAALASGCRRPCTGA